VQQDVHDLNEVHKMSMCFACLATFHQSSQEEKGEGLKLVQINDRNVFFKERSKNRKSLVRHFTVLEQHTKLNHPFGFILHFSGDHRNVPFNIHVDHVDIKLKDIDSAFEILYHIGFLES
jgi:hypothetical protein